MDRNTYRDDDDLDEPATYWWRRAVTLVAGLGVLGLVAWALSSGGGKPPGTPRTTPDSGSMSAAAYPSGPAPFGHVLGKRRRERSGADQPGNLGPALGRGFGLEQPGR